MKEVYVTLRNMLLFFFIVAVFSGTIIVRNNTVADKVIVGLVFGLVMAFLPMMLKFFKLPVNTGSLLLVGIVFSFLFYFLGLYVIEFISITGGRVDVGISDLDFTFEDKTVALVVLSVTSAVLSIVLETLGKQK